MVRVKTPLESWIAQKVTGRRDEPLTMEKLRAYQLQKLQETLDYVREKPLLSQAFTKIFE